MNINTLAAARRALIENLRNAGIENNVQEADWILIRLLNISRAEILGHPETILTEAQSRGIWEIARRRGQGEPLQYILNEAHFWGMPLSVGAGVLVPRPETELLVELALEFLPDQPQVFQPQAFQPQAFLDWGTGSGCIAIALLLERPRAKAVMAEKNPLSLGWAWKNLTRYDLQGRGLLWHSQEPADIPVERGTLDLVVSNPPYIPTKDIPGLMREVKDHEPHLALDGGAEGTDFYRLLFRYAPLWLKPGGALLFEIGDEVQAKELRKAAPSNLEFAREVADYSGIPRCLAWVRL
jgi:release factor glutamine methyltransferase